MWSRSSDRVVIFALFIGYCGLVTVGSFAIEDENGAELYLQRFGYLGNNGYRSGALISQDIIINALKDFQRFAGLNQTGVLDNDTLNMMNKPRCGVSDNIVDESSNRRSKRYALEGSRWRKSNLTYKITKYPKYLKESKVDKVIGRAYEIWSNVTLLAFEQKKWGRVDIRISFERRDHGDRDPFDGPGQTLAHAAFPIGDGTIHFDDEERWTINEPTGVDLLQVAVHEIGHSLGLLHTDERGAIMAPYYKGRRAAVKLHDDDINAIQKLYGARGSPYPPADEEPTGPPPDVSDAPNLCIDTSIDTITRTQNGSTYVFKGNYYWKIMPEGLAEGYPRKISDDWDGLEGNLDASLTWSNGKTFFFKGGRYWRFTNKVMDRGYPKLLERGFEGIPDMLDAAFVWSGNGKTYFFKGENYWRYDSNSEPPVSDKYPMPISKWDGIPNNIDAAFQWENDRTYFFKRDKYYRFNDADFEVDNGDPPFPRSTAIWWFDCDIASFRTDSTETPSHTHELVLRNNYTVISVGGGTHFHVFH